MDEVLFVFCMGMGKRQVLFCFVLFVLLKVVFVRVLIEVEVMSVCVSWYAS